jgi:hypothetical protein
VGDDGLLLRPSKALPFPKVIAFYSLIIITRLEHRNRILRRR